jgi:hypothetical protein
VFRYNLVDRGQDEKYPPRYSAASYLCSVNRPYDLRHRPRSISKSKPALTSPFALRTRACNTGACWVSLHIPLDLRCRIQGMLVRSCLIRRLQPTCPPQRTHAGINTCLAPSQCRAFHQTPHIRARPGMPNHYETLDIPTNATPKDVKKYDIKSHC